MAHTCPDCGSVCYCNGDIDDILIDGLDYDGSCTHCDDRDDNDYTWGRDPDSEDY